MSLSKEQKAFILEKLNHQYSTVKIKCNDHEISLCLERVSKMKLAVGVYVDGFLNPFGYSSLMNILKASSIPHYTNHIIRQSRKLNLLKYGVSVKLKNGMIWIKNMSISCLISILLKPLSIT